MMRRYKVYKVDLKSRIFMPFTIFLPFFKSLVKRTAAAMSIIGLTEYCWRQSAPETERPMLRDRAEEAAESIWSKMKKNITIIPVTVSGNVIGHGEIGDAQQ